MQMINLSKKSMLSSSGLLVLGLLFVAVIVLSNSVFRGAKIDLTEGDIYTLSEGTINVIKSIEEPINLHFFYSEKLTTNIPSIRGYAIRVKEMLQEISDIGGDNVRLKIIDPEPFTESEDEASRFGMQGVPTNTPGENIYLGLAGTDSVDGSAMIPFFDPSKEQFLEYDIAKLIYSLANPKKPVVGLMTGLSLNQRFDPTTTQIVPPWVIREQLDEFFEVRNIQTTATAIEDDVDVLMVVHPKEITEVTQYAIDQFVLAGGRALVFVDPHADIDRPPQDPRNPQAAMQAQLSSNLSKLFPAWGIVFDETKVVGDRQYALQVRTSPTRPPSRHIGLQSLNGDAMDSVDVVSAGLESVNINTSGYFKHSSPEGSNLTFSPLLTSSEDAMPFEAMRLIFMRDPASLLDDFTPTGERYIFAGRLSGAAKSAFSERPSESSISKPHLIESTEDLNIILVADSDILADRMWVRVQDFLGQRLVSAWANNGDFIVNALDNLMGSTDLISIRARASFQRPFTTVKELERAAEQRFQAKEKELQARLEEAERNLSAMQNNKDDGSRLLITNEQKAEVEKFQLERIKVRKQLRQVQHDLNKDIENLGTTLKIVNIGLVPFLITIVALLLLMMRRKLRENLGES